MVELTIIIYILLIAAIMAAIFAIEYKNLMISIVSLVVMNLVIWGVFLFLGATLLAWIQVIVYGGGLTSLFVTVVSLTEKHKDETFSLKRSIIALAIIAAIMALSIWAVVSSEGLYTPSGISSITESLELLWSERIMDLILQAVVFFATSIAIGTLFIRHKKKKPKEEVEA